MKYDAVIVGSGFGGACAAWRLVRSGLKTLLVERGGWPRRDEGDWSQREILIEKRYQSTSPVSVRQYGAREAEPLYPNEVVGGNSVFFGGASPAPAGNRFREVADRLRRARTVLRRGREPAGRSRAGRRRPLRTAAVLTLPAGPGRPRPACPAHPLGRGTARPRTVSPCRWRSTSTIRNGRNASAALPATGSRAGSRPRTT